MRTVLSLDGFDAPRCALAIGKFDGVHRGHQRVLGELVRAARAHGVPSAVLTFDRNPKALTDPARAPSDIVDPARKAALIGALGVDWLIQCPFTRALMDMEPEAFLRLLGERLHPAVIVCGENNAFGRGARGNAALLRAMAPELGYEALIVPLCEVDGDVASSSRVRRLTELGQHEAARKILGRDHRHQPDEENE